MPESSPSRSCEPGLGVGADRDVGPPAASPGAHARAVRSCSGPPRCARCRRAARGRWRRSRAARRGSAREGVRKASLTSLAEWRHGSATYPRAPAGRAAARSLLAWSVARARDPPPRHPHRAASGRSSRATRAGRHLRLRAHGLRARARRQRAAVRRLLPAQALPRARGARRHLRGQHHRHQRQDLRRGARSRAPLGGAGARDDRPLRRRHGAARARAARPRAAGLGDDRPDRRADRRR